jgi:hypothetical protein
MVRVKSGGNAIGRKPLLFKLIFSLDTYPKTLKAIMISLMLRAWVGVITTVSYAYCNKDVVAVGR